jgi:hypothetical protein
MKKLKDEEASQINIFRKAANVAPSGIVEARVSDGVPKEWY